MLNAKQIASLLLLLPAIWIMSVGSFAEAADCDTDKDCKGDRVARSESCVSPPPRRKPKSHGAGHPTGRTGFHGPGQAYQRANVPAQEYPTPKPTRQSVWPWLSFWALDS